MKNHYRLVVYFFFISLIISACSSGKKLLETGNYHDAVVKSVERLRRNPSSKKARVTLQEAYPLAKETYLRDIENLKASNNPFQWTKTAYTYESLNSMYEEIQRSPAAKRIVPNAQNYYGQMSHVRNMAADEQYNAGMKAFNTNSREGAKTAYFHFMDANGFVNGYKDVSRKMKDAKYAATLKVVVNQVAVPSRIYRNSGEQFHDNVANYLRRIENKEFVRFYSFSQAEKQGIQADQIIKMQFEDFVVGETHTFQQLKEVVSDSIKIGDFTNDKGEKKDIIGTVRAELTTNKMEVISKGILSLQIISGRTNARIHQEDFAGQFIWFNEWGGYNGDKRALTNEELRMVKNRSVNPPPPQQLFLEFTKPIYTRLSNRLRRFYADY